MELAKYPQNPEFRDGEPRVRASASVCARAGVSDGGVLSPHVCAWLLLKLSCLVVIFEGFCLFDFFRLD